MRNPFMKSFVYAFKGIAATFKLGRNFKVQCMFAIFALVLSGLLQISINEWIFVLLCIALVLSAESFNTALEAIVDFASPQIHPLAARAKDCAAGAVLIASIFSFIIGLVIFLPKILFVLPLQ